MSDQLLPIPIINPAMAGLNKSQETSSSLGIEWAVEATNCYFDSARRLAARKGWTATAVTPITGSPQVEQVFEFTKADGTTQVVSAANNKLYSGTSTYTDITGVLTPTGNSWQFQNFVDEVVGFQQGHTPIFWNGAGNFAVIAPASGALPTGNAACAAFGRIWASDADGFTLKYCGLLDKTNWGAAGSGSLNMRNVWTRGTDAIVGIYAVGSNLVVFGSRHIIVFADATGSTLGMDPATIMVVDTIEGTGLIGRDTAQPINDGDLLYLSPNGLQSFSRTLVQKNNPVYSLDTQIKDYVANYIANETATKLRSVFSRPDKFYLLILPVAGRIFCYDTLFPLPDGRLRATEWVYTSKIPKCAVLRGNNQLLLGFLGQLGLYSGYLDNAASTYPYTFTSAILTGASEASPELETKIKILKRLGYVVYSEATVSPLLKWGYDFSGLVYNSTVTISGGKIPEYGTAEYGTNGVYNINDPTAVAGTNYSEYAGSATVRVGRTPTTSAGRWLQIGVVVQINGGAFAIQELDAYVKIGRMA
jgi:hypothetical protein